MEAPEFYPSNGEAAEMEHNEDNGIRRDLASDGEEIRASEQDTEVSDTQSEEGSPESAPSDEDEDPADPPAMENKYPLRTRKPKMIFTYHKLGQPTMSHD